MVAEDCILSQKHRISGLVVEYIVAIDVTRARFPADAYAQAQSDISGDAPWGQKECVQRLPDKRFAKSRRWVNSSVVRAADCRSAGPWLKSGLALYVDQGALGQWVFLLCSSDSEWMKCGQ